MLTHAEHTHKLKMKNTHHWCANAGRGVSITVSASLVVPVNGSFVHIDSREE